MLYEYMTKLWNGRSLFRILYLSEYNAHLLSILKHRMKNLLSYIHAFHKYIMIKCAFSQFYGRFLKEYPPLWLGTCGYLRFKEPRALGTSLFKMSNEF